MSEQTTPRQLSADEVGLRQYVQVVTFAGYMYTGDVTEVSERHLRVQGFTILWKHVKEVTLLSDAPTEDREPDEHGWLTGQAKKYRRLAADAPTDDHLHSWRFWGDDPYLRCDCGEIRDVISGSTIIATPGDAPTEDRESFGVRLMREGIERSKSDAPTEDRAPDGSRIVKWITDDRYVDEFGCVWKATASGPEFDPEGTARQLRTERDALAAKLERVEREFDDLTVIVEDYGDGNVITVMRAWLKRGRPDRTETTDD